MKYFIGYLIRGEAAEWYQEITERISDAFGTWRIQDRIPPHITIFRPFDNVDVIPIRHLLRERLMEVPFGGGFSCGGFGRFAEKVVFIKVAPDSSARAFVEDIRERLLQIPGMPQEDFPDWQPHITIANILPPEKIRAIGEYVSAIPSPSFTLPFQDITILRGKGEAAGWEVDSTISADP